MNTLQKMILSLVTIGFFSSYSYVLHAQEIAPVPPPPVVAQTSLAAVSETPMPVETLPEITTPPAPAIHADDGGEDTEDLTAEHVNNVYSDSDDESDDSEEDDD